MVIFYINISNDIFNIYSILIEEYFLLSYKIIDKYKIT